MPSAAMRSSRGVGTPRTLPYAPTSPHPRLSGKMRTIFGRDVAGAGVTAEWPATHDVPLSSRTHIRVSARCSIDMPSSPRRFISTLLSGPTIPSLIHAILMEDQRARHLAAVGDERDLRIDLFQKEILLRLRPEPELRLV